MTSGLFAAASAAVAKAVSAAKEIDAATAAVDEETAAEDASSIQRSTSIEGGASVGSEGGLSRFASVGESEAPPSLPSALPVRGNAGVLAETPPTGPPPLVEGDERYYQ